MNFFSGEGVPPLPRPHPQWGGDTPPHNVRASILAPSALDLAPSKPKSWIRPCTTSQNNLLPHYTGEISMFNCTTLQQNRSSEKYTISLIYRNVMFLIVCPCRFTYDITAYRMLNICHQFCNNTT